MSQNKRSESYNTEEKLSVCEIMKEDSSEIIKKMESQIPLLFQNYSNLYKQYLHMLDDVFGTCFIAEKKFFDSLNIDQDTLRQIKENSKAMKDMHMQNIETSSKFIDMYVKMRIDALKSLDNYTHVMMNSYANYLSQMKK